MPRKGAFEGYQKVPPRNVRWGGGIEPIINLSGLGGRLAKTGNGSYEKKIPAEGRM